MTLPEPSDRPRTFLDLLGTGDVQRLSAALAAHDAGEPDGHSALLRELGRVRRHVERSSKLTAEVRSVMVSAADRALAALCERRAAVAIRDAVEVADTITAHLVDTPPDVSHYVRLLARGLDTPSPSDLLARRKRLNCPGGCRGAGWRWEPAPGGRRQPCPECNPSELPEDGPTLPAEADRQGESGGGHGRMRSSSRGRSRARVLGLDERGKIALGARTLTFAAGGRRGDFGPRSAEARLALGLALLSGGQEPDWVLPPGASTWSHVVGALEDAGATFTGAGRDRRLARRVRVDPRLHAAVASAAS